MAALVRHGLHTVFGVGGTHTVPLLGAMERNGHIAYVSARTELGAAYMAIGYARATGRPGVALTSTGPGALNALAALQDSLWSSLPMIHLTTTVAGEGFAGAVHETPAQTALCRLAGKATVTVEHDAVDAAVEEAVRLALTAPRGPVTLEVPAGAWGRKANAAGPGEPGPSTASPAQSTVEELRAAVSKSSRPLVYVGGGAVRDDGGAAVLAAAESLGAPILTSYQGKGVADWSHPLYLGPWASEAGVRALCAESDLALVFGSKLSALGTDQWRLPLPEATYRIGLDGRTHPKYPHLRDVVADAGDVATLLQAAPPRPEAWAEAEIARQQGEVRSAARERGGLEIGFVEALTDGAGTPRIVTADMTRAGFWVMKYLPVAAGGQHAFSSYLTMGTALPMAVGLAVGADAPVLAVIGDGALQMSLSELGTLAERQLPVTLLLIVDGAYGMLAESSSSVGGSERLGLELWNPDFATLGRAFGFVVEETASPAEVAGLLEKPVPVPRLVLVHQPFSRRW